MHFYLKKKSKGRFFASKMTEPVHATERKLIKYVA